MASKNDPCIEKIMAASEGTLSRLEAAKVLKLARERMEAAEAAGLVEQLDQAVNSNLERIGDQKKFQAMMDKRKEAISLVRRNSFKEFGRSFIEGDPAKIGDAVRAFLGGTVDGMKLSRKSVDYHSKDLVKKALGRLLVEPLEEANLLKFVTEGKFEKEIANEIFQLNTRAGKPGITGNKQALEAAKIMREAAQYLFARKNRAGATEFALDGFVTSQSHDGKLIRRAAKPVKAMDPSTWRRPSEDDSFNVWMREMLEGIDGHKGIDLERSFKGMSAKERADAMRQDYNGFIHGHHIRTEGKIGQSRTYHWPDAESWLAYNKKYGTGSLLDSISAAVEHNAREIAVLETMGPDGKANVLRGIEELKDEFQHSEAAINSLNNWKIKAMLDQITAAPNRGHATWGQFWQNVRVASTLSKLGGSGAHSINDVATTSDEIKFQGMALGEAYKKSLGFLTEGRGNAEKKKIALAFGAGIQGILGKSTERWGITDIQHGFMGRLSDTMFKWNGLKWLDESMQSGLAHLMAHHHGENAHLSYDKLPTRLRELFDLYGVEAHQWDIYRSTVWEGDGGQKYLTPDRMQDVDRSVIEAALTREGRTVTAANVARYRDELDSLFSTIVTDRLDFAVPKPGIAEQAYLQWGTEPGSFWNEIIKTLMQFKGYSVAAARKGIGKQIAGRGALPILAGSRVGGVIHYIAASSIMGYLGYAATDIAKGKKPRNPLDPKTWFDSVAKGGGAGIYGDFLFGDWKKTSSILGNIAGPTFGQIVNLADIAESIKSGSDPAAKIFTQLQNNAPFINLFYARGALDYLWLYQVREWLSPGYLKRMEQRLKTERGQTFFVPPSRVIPHGGGNYPLVPGSNMGTVIPAFVDKGKEFLGIE